MTRTHVRMNNKLVINTIKWEPKTLLKFSYIQAIDEALSTDGYY